MRLETVSSVQEMSSEVYNPDSEGCVPYELDVSTLRWYHIEIPGDVIPMEEKLWDKYGLILLVF